MAIWQEHKTLIIQTALSLIITLAVSFSSFYFNVSKMDDRLGVVEKQNVQTVAKLEASPDKGEVVFLKEFEPFKSDLTNQFKSLDSRLSRLETKQDRIIELLLAKNRVTAAASSRDENLRAEAAASQKEIDDAKDKRSKLKFWVPVYNFGKKLVGKDD